MSTVESFWRSINGSTVLQGDMLLNCAVPLFRPGVESPFDESMDIGRLDLIVVTQSCDLENEKVRLVALCPVHTLHEFEEHNPDFAGKWETVRQGRREGVHMLASPTDPANNQDALAVDFRMIVSLPISYVRNHASQFEERWRLTSPYLEHFSQSFARFFMRVGLPSAIPKFK